MLSRLSHTRLLRSAGLYTWALVGIPIVGNAWFLPPSSGVDDQGINVPLALLAYLLFGVSYWLATRSLASRVRSLTRFSAISSRAAIAPWRLRASRRRVWSFSMSNS